MAVVESTYKAEIARINFRLPNAIKEQIERAAAISGKTLTDFAVAALAATASQVLETSQITTLSDRDRDLFLKLIDGTTQPTDALKRAAANHKRLIKR